MVQPLFNHCSTIVQPPFNHRSTILPSPFATIFPFPVSLKSKASIMRKYVLCIVTLIFLSQIAFSQAYEGKIDYDKKKQAAFVIEFPYPSEAVENAFTKKMEKLGYKGKEEKGIFNKDKGFRVYKNAYITSITTQKMDYVIEVERKSRKEKDEAVLYMIILKGDDNAISAFDASDMENAKNFLNSLLPEVEAANLELEIRSQEEIVAKAQKKLKTLESDKSDMEDKIRKLQNDIEKNIRDQEDTQKDIENQKEVLEGLKLKRKSS
jgi:hypothetical protein